MHEEISVRKEAMRIKSEISISVLGLYELNNSPDYNRLFALLRKLNIISITTEICEEECGIRSCGSSCIKYSNLKI